MAHSVFSECFRNFWVGEFCTLQLICIALFGVVVNCILNRWRRMTLLKRCGIPGPQPHPLTGNMNECFSKPNVVFDSELINKYGSVCGYYLGAKPIILISDPAILKKIEVGEAKNFRNRPRRVPGGINPDPKRTEMLGNLPPEKWQETRKVLSKAFTPLKLKEMVPQVQEKIQIFMKKINTHILNKPEELELDFYPLFQALTLDIIGQTGFGVQCHIQNNLNDPLHLAVQSEFAKSPSSRLVKTYLCLPELTWLIQPIRVVLYKIQEHFGFSESSQLWDTGFQTFHERKLVNSPRRPDILQQLLDSHLSEKPLRVVANSVLFFEAAYETLSSSLAFIVHLLVTNPEVQDRVREELSTVLGDKSYDTSDTLDENDIKKLKYLEAVVKEGLRMYPPQTTFIGRSGDESMKVEHNGREIIIPSGVHVQAGLYQLHHSPEHWELPEKFIPERFLDENVASAAAAIASGKWQAFGLGPRVCIGQSFAWMVLKLVLGNLLMKYELQPGPNTEMEKITLHYKIATMTPKFGSFAKVNPVLN